MEILRIIFAVMIVMSLLAMVLLFIDGGKYGENTLVFNSIGVWAIFVSWMEFTSLPINYSAKELSYQLRMSSSLLFGAMSIIAICVFFIKREKSIYARAIMAGSIAGGMLGLLL